jgi:autotransporter-associated beta strand protein
MKVNLKRFFRLFRKFLTAGGIAAATVAGGTGEAALVLSNGSFASPNIGTSYGSYFNGGNVANWSAHNLYPGGGSNGNLNLMTEVCQSTGGLSAGQYVLAQRAADPVAVFSGGVGNTLAPGSNNVIESPSNGLYIDQTIGTLDSTDLTKSFSLSANLLRALGPTGIYYNVPPPTWAGAGLTIGFVNGNTGAILAQNTISYTQSLSPSDTTTTFSGTDTVTWNAAGSGLPAGTPINVFVGFRLNPGLGNSVDYNTVAVNNVVLTSTTAASYPSLTWTGNYAPSPAQWSTNGSVLNWSNSGTASAYTDGALVTFDDSVGTGSTTVAISAADVKPVGVIFNNSAKSYTLQGPFAIAGGAYLTVSGGGLVTVTNSNSYTGGTNISNGTLKVGDGGSIGSGDIVVNGALIYSRSDSVTTFSTISGSGSVTQQGPGLMTLAGINAYTGATNVSGGTLQIGNGDSATLASTSVVLSNSAALAFDHSTIANYSGAISGVGSVIKAGSGTLTLSGANNYTNGTIVNAGTLVLTGNGTYGGRTTVNGGYLYALIPLTGPATVNGGNLYANSSLAGPVNVNNGGVLGGSGTAGAVSVASGGGIEGGANGIGTLALNSLAYSGSGTFLTNRYANYAASVGVAPLDVTAGGGLNPGAGPVAINLGGPVATSSGTYHLIQYAGAIGGSGSAAFVLGTASNVSGRCALTYGLVNNPGYIDVAVSLTPVLWTGSSSTAWNATDTLPAPGNWTFSGGTTNFLPNDIVHFDNSTAAGGTVDISSGVVLPAGVLVNNDASHPYTFTGSSGIGGGASLTKAGAGMATLSNANSYSGGTTVNGGTLTITNASIGLPAGTVTVNAGGTVNFAQNGENNRGLGGRNFYIAGSGNAGQGAVVVSAVGGPSDVQIGNVTLTADATFGTYGGNGLNCGIHYGEGMSGVSMNLNNHTVTFVGDATSENSVWSDYFTGTGTISVNSGNFRLNGVSENWNSGVLIINPGAQFATYGNSSWASPVVINGGILTTGNGVLTLSGAVSLDGNCTLANTYFGTGTGIDLTGSISGSGGLISAGGSHILSGSNSYSGATNVSAGTLTLMNANALQGSTLVSGGAGIVFDSSVSTHTFTFGGLGGATDLALMDNGGNPVALSVGANNSSTIYSGGLSAGGSLSKIGNGTLTLGGTNTYTGGTNVNSGKLYVNGSLDLTSTATVAAGATLGGQGTAGFVSVNPGGNVEGGQGGSGSLTVANLTFTGSGSVNVGTLANYATSPAINVSGSNALSTNGAGSITINVTNVAGTTIGSTYKLLSYSGAIAGSGSGAFQLGPLASRATGVLSDPGNELDLKITFVDYLKWTGAVAGAVWNTTAPNWILNSTSGTTTYIDSPGDTVIFDDSASTSTVNLSTANVHPNSVTFNNSAANYTLQGGFGIMGATGLTKNGSGALTITNYNNFSGPLTINGGTVTVAAGGGITTGAVVMSGNSLLVLANSNNFSGPLTIGGGTAQIGNGGTTGSVPGGVLIDTGSGNTLVFNLGGNATIPNFINGNGTFVKNGSGTVTLTTEQSQVGGFTGNVYVNGGTLRLNVPGIASSANGGVFKGTDAFFVAPGATLDVAQQRNLRFSQPVTVTGGTLNFSNPITDFRNYVNTLNLTNAQVTGTIFATGLNSDAPTWTVSGSAGNTITSQLEILANSSVSVFTVNVAHDTAGTDLLWTGNIVSFSDGATFVKDGPGKMVYTGVNSYNGPTTVAGGTLQIGNGGASGNLANGNVTDNATLAFSRSDTFTVANAISGSGNVTKFGSGAVVLTAGNSYTGGTTINAGKLYVNGSLTGAVAVNGGFLGGNGSAANVTVAAGGGIEGGYASAGTLTLASLTYSGSGALNIAPAPSYVPVIVSGFNSMTASGGAGSVVVNVLAPPAASGIYPVLQYSGSIQGTGFAAFAVGAEPTSPRCATYGLVNNPGEIDMNIVVTPVIWTGSASTAWNANDTLGPPKNWTFNGSATNFLPGDIVQFDNSTASGGTINIGNGNVLPSEVLFNNDASHPYTVTGGNGIGGAAPVVKNGPGIVTMTAANSYTGGTTINGGTLQIGNAVSNGAIGSGLYNIAAGGRLYLNYATAVPSGNGTWSNNISGAGTLELNSAQAVNGSAQWGPNSNTATVFGPGFTGTLQVDNGRFDSSSAGLGGASNIIIDANAQFLAWASTYGQSITIAGNGWGEAGFPGALRAAGGVSANWTGPITLSANAGIEAQGGAFFALSGPITGNYQVEFESGGGQGFIEVNPIGTSQNSYGSTRVDSGATVVGGALGVGNQYAFSTGGLFMNGGTLETVGVDFSFANLSGTSGTIGNFASSASTITVGSDNTSTTYGGALVDGGAQSLALTKTGSGRLTLSGANTYTGGTTVEGGTLIVTNPAALETGTDLTIGNPMAFPAAIVPAPAAASAAPVPEPGTLGLFATIAAATAIGLRRRIRLGRPVRT